MGASLVFSCPPLPPPLDFDPILKYETIALSADSLAPPDSTPGEQTAQRFFDVDLRPFFRFAQDCGRVE